MSTEPALQGFAALRAGDAEQRPHDAGLEQRDDDRGGDDQPQVRPHDLHVDGHADAHEEQREQQAAERLDVGFELVAIGRFREQHAGEERAERHRHADRLHQQRGAEHDQQRGRGHHLARAGPGEQAEERIEQIAAREHQRGDGAADQRDDCRRFRRG